MNRRMLYGMIFLLVCLLGGAVSYYYFYSSKPAIPVLYPIETGKRWGFIDKAGKTVVFPAYDYARRFSDGLGAVSMGSWENSRWGFVDAAGTLVIPVRYSYVSSFKEGVAFACEGKYPVWKCGLINHKGEYITPERFDGYGEFIIQGVGRKQGPARAIGGFDSRRVIGDDNGTRAFCPGTLLDDPSHYRAFYGLPGLPVSHEELE